MTEKVSELFQTIRKQPKNDEILDKLNAIVEKRLQKKLGEK